MQMGMMKEHVRGPIKCCETIAKDILLLARAEALLYHPGFTAVNLKAGRVRGQADIFGGESHTRFLGAPIVHTSVHVLLAMLEEVLSHDPAVYEDGWEPDDYGREDLVIEEYKQARVGACTTLTTDWGSGEKQTSDYFMYYVMPKEGRSRANADFDEPQQPSMECLQSTKSPPPNFIAQMSDYYYHHYIGQVRDLSSPLFHCECSNL
jgi:hypothetical protein